MKRLACNRFSLHFQFTVALAGACVLGALSVVFVIELMQTQALTTEVTPHLTDAMLLTLCVLLCLSVWPAHLVVQHLLAPLIRLGQAASDLETNAQQTAPIPVSTLPELVVLFQAFNALQHCITGLRSAQDDVVAARTQTLAHNETRLNHVLNASNEGFWDWDWSTHQVYVNRRCCQLLGLPESVLSYPSETFIESWSPQDQTGPQAAILACLEPDAPTHRELQTHKPDGTPIWLIVHQSVVERQDDGRASRVIGCISDITDRRLAQQALQDRTTELNTILDLSPDGFVALDSANHVRYVSMAFTRITGLDASLLQTLDEADFWRCLYHNCVSDPQPLSSADQGTVIGAAPQLMDTLCTRTLINLTYPVRRVVEVTRRGSPADAVSQILCFRDVTHEADVARLKTEFLSTAAYELRTPLASIYGFAEILLNPDHNDPTRHEFVEIIHRQSHLMSQLLDELLNLSSIEARIAVDFHPVNTPVQALVENIVSTMNLPPTRSAPVISSPHGELSMHVDVNKARQAILNVLSNAYKYSSEGGEVHIVIDLVDAPSGVAMVSISVTDTGIGMTPGQSSQIFDRFYRANRTSKIPGSGLGMSLVKEIADLHGGNVTVDSVPGKGTRIALLFPCSFVQQADGLPAQPIH